MKIITNPLLFMIISLLSFVSKTAEGQLIKGELKKWHEVVLEFEGPETSEMDEYNPFMNYRLDVEFTNGEQNFLVPGFYAADGNAAETSSGEGNKWMVRFTPDKIGVWKYRVTFVKGDKVAVQEGVVSGESAGFMDANVGEFEVKASDKKGIDNRAHGRLQYIGEHYLRYSESGKYFIKLGVDAPENLLAYEDFDDTPDALGLRKKWAPHEKDFMEDAEAYSWQNGKGKGLLGAVNYLASEELNVFSFLTFNIDGDDRNVYPYLLKGTKEEYNQYASNKKNLEAWETYFYKTRFDVSKMEQWERIFSYAETKGMFLHFKTHETETDHIMDNGVFGDEAKLYYRELIARYGHHLALNWNLGEENNQPIIEVLKAANYVKSLDPYHHHLVIHTYPNQDDRYAELIGDQSPLTGASLQLSDEEFKDVHPRVLKWRKKSDSTGKKWALAVDEPGKANIALLPDDEDREHNLARSNALWGTLMAGGYGVEWYFGYKSPNSDLSCQDFRSRDLFWDQNRHALNFFHGYLPFWEMSSTDEILGTEGAFCFSKKDEVYAIYLHPGMETTSIDLGDSGRKYTIGWYNPRNGGTLLKGSIRSVKAKGIVELGYAPSDLDKDWVVLLK